MRVDPTRLFWTAFTAWHARNERRLPYWPVARLRGLQDRRARAIVRHAYDTVPHYRELMDRLRLSPADFRSAADLKKLPITDNRELADRPERFLSSAVDPGRCLTVDTTGTSGRYKHVRHDPHAVFLVRAAGQRSREVIARYVGRTFGYRDLYVGPRGGTRDQVLDFYTSRSWVPSKIDIARSDTSPCEPYQAAFDAINRERPDVITGFGAYIGTLFRHARARGIDLHAPQVVVYGGDHLQPADRRLIEEDLGIPVLSSYQSCEFLSIGYQCRPGSGFHLNMDQVVLRVVDSAGRSLPPGRTGELVISNLINRATVLLNYRIGDFGSLSGEPCTCGRRLPTLERLGGRSEDPIIRPDGETVHESTILPRLYAVPGVLLAQLIQHAHGALTLRVVSEPSAERTALEAGLSAAVTSVFDDPRGVSLVIEHVDDIPCGRGGKFRAIISHL